MNYIFDFFGTLITDNIKVYNEIMSESFDLNILDIKAKIRPFLYIRKFNSNQEALDALLKHLKIQMSREQKDSFFSRLEVWKKSLKLHKETIEVLKELKKRGTKIAIISNDNTLIEDVIHKKEIKNYVDVMLLSHELGVMKPDKKIFQICLDKLKTTPREAIMVGDKPDTDMIAQKCLGIQSILFDPQNRHPEYTGKKIKSLKELLKCN